MASGFIDYLISRIIKWTWLSKQRKASRSGMYISYPYLHGYYYNVNIIWEIVMEKNGFIFEKERGAAR